MHCYIAFKPVITGFAICLCVVAITNIGMVTAQTVRWSIEAPGSAGRYARSRVVTTYKMTDEIRSMIVDANNLVRRNVDPPPADMMKITWDLELEDLATKYSKQCTFGINRKKKMDRFRRVEELIYVSQGIDYDDQFAVQGISRWNEEKKYYNYQTNKCTARNRCKRYTQLAWAASFKVGCGITKCSAISVNRQIWRDATIMVCDYVPGGNWITRRPYLTGPVCSKCHYTDTCVDNLCTNPARDEEPRPEPAWSEWTQWSACPVTCGRGGIRRRTRFCNTFVRKDCAPNNPFARTSQLNFNCAKHIPCSGTLAAASRAYWTRWDSWSSCSKTCGGGSRRRTRGCNTGKLSDCKGSSIMSFPCNGRPCPRWNNWRTWEGCTESCGGGTRIRTRACNSGVNSDCGGSSTESGACNETPCARENPVAEWNTWQAWSGCSETCGGGKKTRSRTCNSGNDEDCPGKNTETEDCNEESCPAWNAWQEWSKCSLKCGGGTRSRSRTCNTGTDEDCPGSNSESESCNEHECQEWNNWQEWSSCTLTCGGGTRSRSRTCSTGNDEDCPGSNIETKACNEQDCPAWNTWQEWNSCSLTCDGGTRSRSRTCNTGNDEDCPGSNNESESCNEQNCPEWNTWQEWSKCSLKCGGGTRSRSRTCNTGTDEDCPGSNSESESCNEQECQEWDTWQEWSSCTLTCGGGTRSKSRTCSTGNDEDCPGSNHETEACNEQECPAWNAWQPWESCSLTCGGGTRSRTRTCNTGDDEDCEGENQESDSCNEDDCVESEWGSWTKWGDCFPRCGPGTRYRTRICINGKVGDDGCAGDARASKYCQYRPCPRG